MTEKVSALRLRHDHTFHVDTFNLSAAFTIDAWVCPAAMGRAALVYPETCFEGQPVCLKPGLYRNLSEEQLPKLGSLDLPDDIEVVFFAAPDFEGAAFAQREDLAEVPEEYQKAGSVVVLDRSHHRQNFVVLFEEPGFKGRARLLVLPDHWQQPTTADDAENDQMDVNDGSPAFGRHTANPLSYVRSAWVPPGIALELLTMNGRKTLRGDLSVLPDEVMNIQPRRDAPLSGSVLKYGDESLDDIARSTSGHVLAVQGGSFPFEYQEGRWLVPDGYALFLFENQDLAGRFEMVVGGRDDLKSLGWSPTRLSFPKTPDGVDGVIAFSGESYHISAPDGSQDVCQGIEETIVIAPGKPMPDTPAAWFPPDCCVVKDNGERVGANGTYHGKSLNGYIVTRFCSILANPAGYGLTIDRQPSALKNAPDELRFGGKLLRPERWYHLAQSWDGATMRWILDGRVVKETNLEGIQIENNGWIAGQGFRGAISQVRIWNQALQPDFIQKNRFPDVNTADFGQDDLTPTPIATLYLPGYATPPDAVLIEVTLPVPPEQSLPAQSMMRQVEVEQQQHLVAANQQANDQKALSIKKAQLKVAMAHEKARRDIHFKGIKQLAFTRGGSIFYGKPSDEVKPHPYEARANDLVIDKRLNCIFTAFESAWQAGQMAGLSLNMDSRGLDPFFAGICPPLTLANVLAENHPLTEGVGDNQIRTGLYWIDADGMIKKSWGYRSGEPDLYFFEPAVDINKTDQEVSHRLPVGRSNTWDLAIGRVHEKATDYFNIRIFWTNGREIYLGDDRFQVVRDGNAVLLEDSGQIRLENQRFNFEILVTHANSPHPVAIAVFVDPNEQQTQVVWLDAEDEVVRVLQINDEDIASFGFMHKPTDLYPAFNPGQGIAICPIPNPDNTEEIVHYLYWVAGERKTLEAAVLDTPGRYFDLYDNASDGASAGQQVELVETEETFGAEWVAMNDTAPTDQAVENNADIEVPALQFRALCFNTTDDFMSFSPIRLNLNQGITVCVRLIWDRPESLEAPVCIYELATFEGEERLVCAIDQNGTPKLYLRWAGYDIIPLDCPTNFAAFWPGQDYTITWMLSPSGRFEVYLNEELLNSGQIQCAFKDCVFEGHRLGAPGTSQDHSLVSWALDDESAKNNLHFDGFKGKIMRFTAWNTHVPNALNGLGNTPDVDKSWARSLATIESRRRYLHAGRLDGQEPPVTLFPIDLDGGLSVESELEWTHAQHTYAQNQLAAARLYEAHCQAQALQQAQTRLSAAQQACDDAHARATADIASAQAHADWSIATEKLRKDSANADAARKRTDGKNQADSNKDAAQYQYDDQVAKAAADKQQRIAAAERQRIAKRNERDAKQWEYDEKSR